MRRFERRALQAYPYYKLATWHDRWLVWQDGKHAFASEAAARRAATLPGRYRISLVNERDRLDLEPFEVPGPARIDA